MLKRRKRNGHPKNECEKKIIENTDTNDKEDNEENSKQKRKGWWSLKG